MVFYQGIQFSLPVLQDWKGKLRPRDCATFQHHGQKNMHRLTGLPADPLEGSSKIIKLLKNEEGKKWTIGLTGGEPFTYPRFVQLCETLTEHFCIYVDTNLSINRRVAEFAKKSYPDQ